MNKTLWERIKAIKPKVVEIIAPNRNPHPWARHGEKIVGNRRLKPGTKKSQNVGYTNHERVQIGRAARMKIKLTEYRVRCAIFQASGEDSVFTARLSNGKKVHSPLPELNPAGYEAAPLSA